MKKKEFEYHLNPDEYVGVYLARTNIYFTRAKYKEIKLMGFYILCIIFFSLHIYSYIIFCTYMWRMNKYAYFLFCASNICIFHESGFPFRSCYLTISLKPNNCKTRTLTSRD